MAATPTQKQIDAAMLADVQERLRELLEGAPRHPLNAIMDHPTPSTMVCMGMDAMRIALGIKPRNYPAATVIQWLIAASANDSR